MNSIHELRISIDIFPNGNVEKNVNKKKNLKKSFEYYRKNCNSIPTLNFNYSNS